MSLTEIEESQTSLVLSLVHASLSVSSASSNPVFVISDQNLIVGSLNGDFWRLNINSNNWFGNLDSAVSNSVSLWMWVWIRSKDWFVDLGTSGSDSRSAGSDLSLWFSNNNGVG